MTNMTKYSELKIIQTYTLVTPRTLLSTAGEKNSWTYQDYIQGNTILFGMKDIRTHSMPNLLLLILKLN